MTKPPLNCPTKFAGARAGRSVNMLGRCDDSIEPVDQDITDVGADQTAVHSSQDRSNPDRPSQIPSAQSRLERIRLMNDRLRQTGEGGTTVCTAELLVLDADTLGTIGDAVRAFDAFDADNDPHGEHDFGSLTVDGYRVMFKIDAYDLTMQSVSSDPADPTVTKRVLTIMLAEEY